MVKDPDEWRSMKKKLRKKLDDFEKIKTAAEDRLKWTALAFNLLQRKKKMS